MLTAPGEFAYEQRSLVDDGISVTRLTSRGAAVRVITSGSPDLVVLVVRAGGLVLRRGGESFTLGPDDLGAHPVPRDERAAVGGGHGGPVLLPALLLRAGAGISPTSPTRDLGPVLHAAHRRAGRPLAPVRRAGGGSGPRPAAAVRAGRDPRADDRLADRDHGRGVRDDERPGGGDARRRRRPARRGVHALAAVRSRSRSPTSRRPLGSRSVGSQLVYQRRFETTPVSRSACSTAASSSRARPSS